jgi:hypothetical protein
VKAAANVVHTAAGVLDYTCPAARRAVIAIVVQIIVKFGVRHVSLWGHVGFDDEDGAGH